MSGSAVVAATNTRVSPLRHLRPRSRPSPSSQRASSMVPRAGFFKRLMQDAFEGGQGSAGDENAGANDTQEMAALRSDVLQGTVLAGRELILAYDAGADGWDAITFHNKVDNAGPAVLIGKTKGGALFGAFNPLGWASREDYGDSLNAFLYKYPSGRLDGNVTILSKVGGPGAAIFDFGAEGPIFGADALKIPLGEAPSMGSSYAVISDGLRALSGEKQIRSASCRLGSYYAGMPEGPNTLFTKREGKDAQLTELRVYCGEGLGGFYA